MAEEWVIFGHQTVKKLLETQLANNTLSHAYLLRGPEAVGKKSLAMEFAKKVLHTEVLANHPDFSLLDAEGEITVEQIHDFMHSLSFKPFAGAKKVAILNNAQNLNIQSSNALLKTLEEPSSSTIIILISNGSVLPTIISRCQTFYFYPLSNRQLQDYATKNKIDSNLVELSYGRLGRLQNLSDNPKLVQESKERTEEFKKLVSGSVHERILKISQYADLESVDLEKVLQTWILWLRFELVKNPKLFRTMQSCLDAQASLRANLNKKLILQALFLKI